MLAGAIKRNSESPERRPRLGRLTGRNRFGPILAKRRVVRGEYLQVFVGDSVKDAAMLGVGVSKAVAKHASARNYMRRAVREEVRKYVAALPPVELVVLVRRMFDRHGRAAMAAELSSSLHHLKQLRLCAAS